MSIKQSKKIATYVLFGVLIFAVIKIIPNNKLNNIDSLLISLITVVICSFMEKNMFQLSCSAIQPMLPPIQPIKRITKYPNNNYLQSAIEKFDPFTTNTTNIANANTANTANTNTNKSDKSNTNTNKSNTNTKSVQPVTPIDLKLSNTKSTANCVVKTTQILLNPEKISFPFSEDYLKTAMNDILKAKDDKLLADKVRSNAKANIYYEIFVQLVQTNIEAVYRNLKKDFNILNEIILDVKLKRSINKQNPIIIDGKELSVSVSRELSNTVSSYLKKLTGQGKYMDSNGFIQNIVNNDMKYSLYSPTQNEKLGTYDSSFTNEWVNDYALLNTDKWRPPITNSMYKCKTEKQCPVCPSMTTGYPVKLKEFDIARKILPPDMINTDYINEKLNLGLA